MLESAIQELTVAVRELTAAMQTAPKATKEKAKPIVEKVEEKKEAVEQTTAAATEPVATPPIAEAPAVQEQKAVSYDDVRAAFMALNQAKGREATLSVLSKLDADKVPNIKPERFAEAVELAKAAM